jgi:hypothetical protein
MESTLNSIIAATVLIVAIGVFGAISYAMTAKDPRVRFWGCRIAATFFFIFGAAFIGSTFFMAASNRGAYFWSIVMFGVAGWQWRLSTAR